MMQHILLALSLLVLVLINDAYAGQYTAPDLYEADYRVLENGMRVITQKRDVSRNISIVLKVNVGFDNFDCIKRDTPHFLEHLLFTGTSKHDEYGLERLIEDAGGTANASTGRRGTSYSVSIYSGNARTAFEYLYEIMTDSKLSEDDVLKTRIIINRERGGDPSWLRMALYERGIGKNGIDKMTEMLGIDCPNLVTSNDVIRDDVVAAFNKFYVPSNMVLVVVGDFVHKEIDNIIDETLGAIESQKSPQDGYMKGATESLDKIHHLESTLSPVIDTEESIGIAYTGPGGRSSDIYALRLMEAYLDEKVFEKVRIDGAYSYAPSVYLYEMEDISILDLAADVEPGMGGRVRELIEGEFSKFLQGDLDEEEFESIKQGLLYNYATGYVGNSSVAHHYAKKAWELDEYGTFVDEAGMMEKATLKEVRDIAAKYYYGSGKVLYRDKPTLTYTQLYIVITFIIGVMLLVIGFGYRSRMVARERKGSGLRHNR